MSFSRSLLFPFAAAGVNYLPFSAQVEAKRKRQTLRKRGCATGIDWDDQEPIAGRSRGCVEWIEKISFTPLLF